MSVYACADLHGCLDLYNQINNFIKPEDTVIFLGDACDRGPQPWKTVTAILDNPQWIYLMGNHEQMALEPLIHWQKYGKIHNNFLSFKNDGKKTFREAIKDPDLDRYIQELRKLPLYYEYQNVDGFGIVCSHAGFTPWFDHTFIRYSRPSAPSLLWGRDHILDSWNEDEMCQSIICVHGHTPQVYITHGLKLPERVGALWYCNDHKVCLDTGCWATDYTVLLDLDTFDEHIFRKGE